MSNNIERCSGPYRRVSKEEYDALTAAGVPGEIAEGCGHVVYDEQARAEYAAKIKPR